MCLLCTAVVDGRSLSIARYVSIDLWRWKAAIVERLATLRPTAHERSAQVMPAKGGVPWLGFVVHHMHRRIKARNVRGFTRRLRQRWADYAAGRISFAELDATVRGWVAHARHGDTWGLRRHLLTNERFVVHAVPGGYGLR